MALINRITLHCSPFNEYDYTELSMAFRHYTADAHCPAVSSQKTNNGRQQTKAAPGKAGSRTLKAEETKRQRAVSSDGV